jgi:hypothetical protein
LAVEVANLLAKNGALDPGFLLPSTSKASDIVYLHLVQEYSATIAPKYPAVTIPLLEEIVTLCAAIFNSPSALKRVIFKVHLSIYLSINFHPNAF